MWLTDRTFLQMRVAFCEYLVFHEFRRNLYITLDKYLEQEGIADLLLLFFKFNIIHNNIGLDLQSQTNQSVLFAIGSRIS